MPLNRFIATEAEGSALNDTPAETRRSTGPPMRRASVQDAGRGGSHTAIPPEQGKTQL